MQKVNIGGRIPEEYSPARLETVLKRMEYAINSLIDAPEAWIIPITDETSTITTGTAKVTLRWPYSFLITAVRASLTTGSSSGSVAFDINESGTTILSTKITIDEGEKTSETAATAPVISDTILAKDAEITFDIDTAGTDAVAAKITIIGFQIE